MAVLAAGRGLRVTSAASAASIPAMTRRRTYLARPHDALIAAAKTHGRIVTGEPHPSETGDGGGTETEATQPPHHAQRQRRNQEGKFA